MNSASESHLSRSTQVAFGVIIVFLVAQVAWWLWFQADYIGEVRSRTEAVWQNDAARANELLAFDSSLADELLAGHLHLQLNAGAFEVDPTQLAAFKADQQGHLRMFRFEGVFFVIIVLAGLWVLARSLLLARGLEQRQRNFLLAVTHELRTPISTLRLLVETLQYRSPAPEKLDDYLERMGSELRRLEESSDRVLASARLEQVESSDDLQPTDLNTAVREVIAKHRAGLETRQAAIRVAYGPVPLTVDLDQAAFETALSNLLDNAVKYSPGVPKLVHVSVEGGENSATLTVADEGVGVQAEEAKRIFERFYRPGSEMTRKSQGVGLGLHLVQSIAGYLGGTVRHEPNSTAGRGSLFVITLPLSRTPLGLQSLSASQSDAGERQPVRRHDAEVEAAGAGRGSA